MPRHARVVIGGYVYHVLNRANGRVRLFRKDADFAAFEQVLVETQALVPLRLLGYTLMSNHWHFVVWPRRGAGEQVAEFFRRLSVTHAQRWHAHHSTSGMGHVYQGRYKSFPVASDEHLLSVLRYVERNPLRAGLVDRAEAWRWGSLHRRATASIEPVIALAEPPVRLPSDWVKRVNQPQSEAELSALRQCAVRGQPYGSDAWREKVAEQLNLTHTLRPRGRPRKQSENETESKK